MIKIKSMCKSFLSAIVGLAVPVAFAVLRFVKDQVFLSQLQSTRLTPSPAGRLVAVAARVSGHLQCQFRRAFDDYALRKYVGFIQHHYSKSGRGYFSYEALSPAAKVDMFGKPAGRIGPFIDRYGDLLRYADGDTFFDAGCGRGQNVKVLMDRFPASAIHGMDLSAEAAEVVTLAADGSRVTAGPGDLTDVDTLKAIADDRYDHVVLSHVLSVIIGAGIEATAQTRARIIGELARIARKSLLIIDSPAILSDHQRFKIEQRDRGAYVESILKYFQPLPGRTVVLFSAESVAVLYWPS